MDSQNGTKVMNRLYSSHMRRIALAKDPEMSELSKRNLVVAVIFENFMIPSILRPEQYGVIAGYGIGHRERNNLIQVALSTVPI